ncbi:MAG: hypothetical protein HY244_19935 [Rhizobiales bacterium]|nr:hypothetical protein [Hyphomicrobiales bacterium]
MNEVLADDLADFNAAVENASAHNRVAIGYLRTGNLDLALLEIDRLRESWGALERRFAGKRQAAFDGNPHYATLWTAMNTRFVGIDLMISMGKPDAVRKSLEEIRGDLYDLRKAAGIVVLADCVRDANAGMDALMAYDDRSLDFAKPQALATTAQSYSATLARCDGIAGDAIRKNPEFRRLVDGAKASLALIAKAIETRDGDLLHRVLIELRSFDNLLAFRFG